MVEFVATVLTVYGIETHYLTNVEQVLQTLQKYLPFTVLKPPPKTILMSAPPIKLQQYLPFTVLKPPPKTILMSAPPIKLQQYLPFTVLKLDEINVSSIIRKIVATVLTVYGIETTRIDLRDYNHLQ